MHYRLASSLIDATLPVGLAHNALTAVLSPRKQIGPSDLALIGEKVYGSPTQPPIENAAGVIHDGRIAAVGPRSSTTVPGNAETLDGIKLFAGSNQGDGKVVTLPLAIAKAGADEAHRHHLPVFAHPQDVTGLTWRSTQAST